MRAPGRARSNERGGGAEGGAKAQPKRLTQTFIVVLVLATV